MAAVAGPPLSPEQAAEAEARRQRAMLLRSFEASPLSKANFGALKGLGEAALDALLDQAWHERAERGERPERADRPDRRPSR
jgi:ProP effector